MALGDIKNKNNATRAACLMVGATANVAAPTLVTDGIANYPTNAITIDDGACFTCQPANFSTLVIAATAGSGSLTGVFTLYGYLAAFNGGAGQWFPIKVNTGSAVTGTGSLAYCERFLNLGHFDRLALGLASIGGSSTPTMEAWVITGQDAF